jgi:hypothetical protein
MESSSIPATSELEGIQWDETKPVVFPDTEAVTTQPESPPPAPAPPALPPCKYLLSLLVSY